MIQRPALLEGMARAHCAGRRIGTLWGKRYWIHPTFIGSFGDGLKPMWFEPLDSRPEYYVLLADSSWSTSNFEPEPFCDHLEAVAERILSLFGEGREEYEHDNGRTYVRHNPFPAFWDGSGCSCWGDLELEK